MISSTRRLFSSSTHRFRTSILGNGVQVATVDSPGTLYATGLLIKTDVVPNIPVEDYICSLYSIEKATSAQLQEAIDTDPNISGASQVRGKKEHLILTAVGQSDHLQRLTEVVSETVQRLQPDMSGEISGILEYDRQDAENKPMDYLPELMHEAAFSGTVLGSSLNFLQNTRKYGNVSEAWKQIFQPHNLIVVGAGAGVEHEQFEELVNNLYGGIQSTVPEDSTEYKTPFKSKLLRIERPDEPLLHMGIALKSHAASHPSAFAMAILQTLLGGGGSFSSGGPGKGMYSRLFTQVLNRVGWVESAKQLHSCYSQVGYFGIQASAAPDRAKDLVWLISKHLNSMGDALTLEELMRAKNQVKSAVLSGLESRPTQLEDLAEQMHYLGPSALLTPSDVCSKVDGVTREDVMEVASNLWKSGKDKPAIVAFGPTSSVPDYERLILLINQ